jgi:hypothetical protein
MPQGGVALATVNAIAAVCSAITHILETALEDERTTLGFDTMDLTFQVFGAEDFVNRTIPIGVSVFLYRVVPNLVHRTPAGRMQPNGQRRRSRLPLDLHLLVTAWGNQPDTHNRLVGWMVRTLEDYPTLPPSLLNLQHPDTFSLQESVELVLDEMPGEELLHLWELLGNGETHYQTTVPYVARAVMIDSTHDLPTYEPVQVRTFETQRIVSDA